MGIVFIAAVDKLEYDLERTMVDEVLACGYSGVILAFPDPMARRVEPKPASALSLSEAPSVAIRVLAAG